MATTSAPRLSLGIQLHPRYGLLTLGYLVAIYWLSSLPDLSVGDGDPLVQLASNLFHIPLFAGLSFCFAQAISEEQGKETVQWKLSGLTFFGTGAVAALDEWHQSLVPGRHASLSDFFLNLAGILGVVLVLRVQALRRRGS